MKDSVLDREINQQSTKLPPYFVFCFGITYDCVKRVQASNNTLLDKPVNGVACPSNVESEAPNMRIDIQKRNMQHHCPCPEEQFLGGKQIPKRGTVPK